MKPIRRVDAPARDVWSTNEIERSGAKRFECSFIPTRIYLLVIVYDSDQFTCRGGYTCVQSMRSALLTFKTITDSFSKVPLERFDYQTRVVRRIVINYSNSHF